MQFKSLLKNNKLVIVILNYNSFSDTVNLVTELRNMEYPIIVVDNNSPNGDYEKIKQIFKNEKNTLVIKTKENKGYSFGNNVGIKIAIDKFNPDFILVLNPDIELKEATIFELIRVAETSEKVGIVAPKMKTYKEESLSAWKLPTFRDDIILSIGILKRILGNPVKYPDNVYKANYPQVVDVVQGACFLVSKNAIIDVNFLDERTFLYGEERILAYKMKSKGYKVLFLPYVDFFHKVGSSTNKSFSNIRKFIILQKSRIIYHKYYLNSPWYKLLLFRLITVIGTLEKVLYYAGLKAVYATLRIISSIKRRIP